MRGLLGCRDWNGSNGVDRKPLAELGVDRDRPLHDLQQALADCKAESAALRAVPYVGLDKRLREALRNPLYISKKDAEERGIEEGDTVKISSQYGETLRRAYVTSRLMPGVVGLPHGPWIRIDEATGIDQSGSENYITGNVARGLGCSGYNTLNVEVSKYDGEAIPEDVEIPQTILFV